MNGDNVDKNIINAYNGGQVIIANDNSAVYAVQNNNSKVSANSANNCEKFQNNKKQDYIDNWNSRLFLHIDNDERPITLADAFIMPDYNIYKSIKRIDFLCDDELDEIIDKFVNYQKTSSLLITGVPGIGKSTITSWIANKHKEDDKYLFLKFRDWESEELESGLLKSVCFTLGCKKNNLENKILILDGFDEIKTLNIREKLLNDFTNDLKDFENFKVIITSRPTYITAVNFDNYLELCPLDPLLIRIFYEKITNQKLKGYIDYDNIDVLGIPVILYMAIMSDINITKRSTKPKLYKRIFAKKGGIFDRFSYEGIAYSKGTHILGNSENIDKYLQFLRKTAFSMFEKNSLSLIKNEFDIPNLVFQGNDISVLEFPIKYLFEDTETNIEFIHKSIYEFFVSEYIFVSICEVIEMSENKVACVLGEILEGELLSEEIIEFLRYRFKKSSKMMRNFDKLLAVFEIMMNNGMTFFTHKRFKKVIDREIIVFANILHILHFWEFDSLRMNSVLISSYICNNKIRLDISNMSLMGADLKGANLYKANLQKANLRKTDLRRSDLRGSDLREANLSGSNLEKADLRGANLEGSIWFVSDIRKVLPLLSSTYFKNIFIRENNGLKKLERSELSKLSKI